MLFPKDGFTKHMEQVLQIVSQAESLIAKAEGSDNTEIDPQLSRALELASARLKALYSEISANATTWDESTLKKNKGHCDNLLTRYKSVQQRTDSLGNTDLGLRKTS